MLNHQKQLLKFVSVLFLWGILLFSPIISFAEENICFNESDASKIIVELERGRIIEKNTELLEKQNLELIKQIEILNQQKTIINEKLKSTEELLVKNETLYKMKEVQLEKDLKEAKKIRWTPMFMSAGLGSIVTLIAIILL